MLEYENRVVAFVDILGFKEAIRKTEDYPVGVKSIYEMLYTYSKENELREKSKGFRNGDGSALKADDLEELSGLYPINVTQFSDSFVFSAKADDVHACSLLMFIIGTLMDDVFKLGFLLRGGVSVGKLVHDPNGPLFGPAFLEAYDIEQKQAVYSRIVVSKECKDRCTEFGGQSVPTLGQGLDFVESSRDGLHEITLASFLSAKLSKKPEKCRDELQDAIASIDKRVDQLEKKERLAVEQKIMYVKSGLCEKLEKLKDITTNDIR